MKHLLTFLLTTIFLVSSCSTVQNAITAPSSADQVNAVRELMNGSAFRALNTLSNVSNRGIEALLPAEIQPVIATLKTLGLGDQINKLNKQLGIASEAALVEGKGLMSDAVSQINIENAADIILGNENAATSVLRDAMYGAVTKRYSDRMEQELSKVDETKYWDQAVTAYNLFSDKKITGSLSENLSRAAVDAVFVAMGAEEAKIRKDPTTLNNEVVTRVFDYYKNRTR